ncbi:hypothetical protein GS501_02835 [Saccharibacter sp. 17.LH.SD]|uniref:tetratricopeptide repeat protein n=1 Tax=Saccharibacter sp. 17.LH.SD TaxID=2689393 RepID=UPI00137211E9|nr:hypothetical protein [Saccharibacter sp. 17.LH.SD]MXV43989.1 hypothetical protein [Saccharibacter sp. 17.LH.SD]
MPRYVVPHIVSKVVLSAMICTPLLISAAHADGTGLSRDEIMRHHRQLAQQYQAHESNADGGSEASSSGNGSDAPLAAPLSASGVGAVASQGSHGGDTLVAQLLNRVNDLEGQVREMRGELDQLTNQQHQDEADMNKKMSDLQFAMQGNDGGHSAPVPAPVVAPRKAPKAEATEEASSPQSAAQNIQQGKAALKAKHYDEAERQARAALQTAHSVWGKTEAQFLLAQSLAGQKSYRQAAVAYYDVYTQNPHSERAPQALLGVSGSMLALGNKGAACEALGTLKEKFPNASPRVKASEEIFRGRAACH